MIEILLATYNGGKYLRQQLDSILNQTCREWQLLVRDDGSDDNTVEIIKDYIERYPGKIILISDNKGRLGACLNFGELLNYSTADYIMFSDQDDVWLPKKIQLTFELMKSAEVLYPDRPLLVHTDLIVVDSDLNVIAESMWNYHNICPTIGDDLAKTLVEGVVSGCTMMINKRAKDVSSPIPREAIIHDWWIAVHVAKHGKIIYSSVPLILYRQHFGNKIGAKKKSISHFLKKVFVINKQVKFYVRQARMIKKSDYNGSSWPLFKNKLIIIVIKALRSL